MTSDDSRIRTAVRFVRTRTVSGALPLVISCLVFSERMPARAAGTDTVTLQDQEIVSAQEVFYAGGKIEYKETGTVQPYTTTIPPVQNPPILNTWESDKHAGTRTLTGTSLTPVFAVRDTASTDDSALLAFRASPIAAPSAVATLLRIPASKVVPTATAAATATITLPAHSIAYSGMIFRDCDTQLVIQVNGAPYEGANSSGFFPVAANPTAAPMSITITGYTQTSAGRMDMALVSNPAGNGVYLVTGRFGTSPAAVAASVILLPQ